MLFMEDSTKEAIASAVKSAPPIAVSIWQKASDGLPHVVLWMTAIYTALQLYFLIRDKVMKK